MSNPVPQTTRGVGRETLLTTAAELFASRGYRATTLDDVAGALGIKKATLYHYIRSKEDLLSEIYDQIFDRVEAVVRPIASSDAPADIRLHRMLEAHLRLVASERDMLAVAFQEEAELPAANRDLIRSRKRSYERIFEDVVLDGQREGLLRPMDARIAVRGLLGMTNWIYQWYSPDRHSIDRIADTFAGLLENGWLRTAAVPMLAEDRSRATTGALSGEVRSSLVQARDQIDRVLEGRLGSARSD